MKNCLIIFTRNPELGKVKSRLAADIGKENALEVYIKLLEHTKNVVSQVNCTKMLGYSVKVRTEDSWDNTTFNKFQQKGEDLGIRMQNAFATAFKNGHNKVLIVGSDLLDLKVSHIEDAFTALENNDVVIGPAQDGGYYLLGMNALTNDVFVNKNWGTETVYQDTINDLKDQKIHLLETLNDIDYASDLESYSSFKSYLNNK